MGRPLWRRPSISPDSVTGLFGRHLIPVQVQYFRYGSSSMHGSSNPLHIYADPGTAIELEASRQVASDTPGSGGSAITFTISGYLVDVP